jgi:hypothetical protein
MNRQLHWIWGNLFQLGYPFHYLYVSLKIVCWRTRELGLYSVRESVIFEQVVDFEEHCARELWVAWLHGT